MCEGVWGCLVSAGRPGIWWKGRSMDLGKLKDTEMKVERLMDITSIISNNITFFSVSKTFMTSPGSVATLEMIVSVP